MGDNIVHAFWKQMDTCNRLVAGSSPAGGAISHNTHPNTTKYYERGPERNRSAESSLLFIALKLLWNKFPIFTDEYEAKKGFS